MITNIDEYEDVDVESVEVDFTYSEAQKTLAFRVIYTLIIHNYQAEWQAERRAFYPKRFCRHVKKLIPYPELFLEKFEQDGYIMPAQNPEKNKKKYKTITEKFSNECRKYTHRRLSVYIPPVAITLTEREKKTRQLRKTIELERKKIFDSMLDLDISSLKRQLAESLPEESELEQSVRLSLV